MGYIKNVILYHVAGFNYEVIPMDGHVAFAGKNDTGKTTLAVAMAYSFLIDNNLIYGRGDNDRAVLPFDKFYLDKPYSVLFYDAVNIYGEPFCVAMRRHNDRPVWEFIEGAFDGTWLVGTSSWPDIEKNIRSCGVRMRPTVDRQPDFRRIVHGIADRRVSGKIRGTDGWDRFALFSTEASRSSVSNLLSHVFQKSEFTQGLLRSALLEAVMTQKDLSPAMGEQQRLEAAGMKISLKDHWQAMTGFFNAYRDIQLMTQVNPDTGRYPMQDVVEKALSVSDEYNDNVARMSTLPACMKYAIRIARERVAALDAAIALKDGQKKSADDRYQSLLEDFKTRSEKLSEENGRLKERREAVSNVKERYKDDPIDVLVRHSENVGTYRTALADLRARRQRLAAGAPDVANAKSNYDIAVANLKAALQKDIEAHGKERQQLDAAANRALKAAIDAIDADYQEKIASAQRKIDEYAGLSPETPLLEVRRLAHDTERIETVDAVRKRFDIPEGGPSDEKLNVLIVERGLAGKSAEALAREEQSASDALLSVIEDRLSAERARAALIDKREKDKNEKRAQCRNRIQANARQYEEKVRMSEETSAAAVEDAKNHYEAMISGDNAKIKEEFDETDGQIADLEGIFDLLASHPTLAADKAVLDGEPALKVDEEAYAENRKALAFEKAAAEKEYVAERAVLVSERNTLSTERAGLSRDIDTAMSMLSMVVSLEMVEEAATDRPLRSLNEDFGAAALRAREMEESGELKKAVQRLYDSQQQCALSRDDTFKLGFGPGSKLTATEDYLAVAAKLRALLSSDKDFNIRHFSSMRAGEWFSSLMTLAHSVDTMEDTKAKISGLCHRVNRFIRENNNTNCVDEVELEYKEAAVTDAYGAVRAAADFWHENSAFLGEDNIFSIGSDINDRMVYVLKDLSEKLDAMNEKELSIEEMFSVRIHLSQKGQDKVLESFKKNGSEGTTLLTKMMLIMALGHEIMGRQKNAVKIPILLDEMNNLDHENLADIMKFADKAGFVVIMTGIISTCIPNYLLHVKDAVGETADGASGRRDKTVRRWIRHLARESATAQEIKEFIEDADK